MSQTELRDRLDVIEACTRFGWHTDQRDWGGLVGVFAEQVRLHDTGSGAEPRLLSNSELVASWAKVFVGVDATQHQITDHLVELAGDTAICTAQYRVQHTVAAVRRDPVLVNQGHYRFGLVRASGGWRIDSVTTTTTWSFGDPAILTSPAVEDAAAAARGFLESISASDLDSAFARLAENVVMDMPFAPSGSPTELKGGEAVRRLYTGLVSSVQSINLPVLSVMPFADPEWVLVEYKGEIMQPNGKPYDNHYYGMFRVVNGLIVLFRELYDTVLYTEAVAEEDRAGLFQTAGD